MADKKRLGVVGGIAVSWVSASAIGAAFGWVAVAVFAICAVLMATAELIS